jgi:uncharacterized protein YeaO (DUF488 family)
LQAFEAGAIALVRLKRAYEAADAADGYRVLVERLWPRGLRKERAHFAWMKDIAPSDLLRTWFHRDPARWAEFEERYKRELQSDASRTLLDDLVRRAGMENVTLVYSSHDEEHNSAVVLKREIQRRLRRTRRPRASQQPSGYAARGGRLSSPAAAPAARSGRAHRAPRVGRPARVVRRSGRRAAGPRPGGGHGNPP